MFIENLNQSNIKMDVKYRIFVKKNLIISTFPSLVTIDTIKNLWGELTVDPLFDPDYNHLILLTRVRKFRLDHIDIKTMGGNHPFSSRSRRAAVTDSDHIYGMHRIYERYLDSLGENFRVFRFIKEAYSWVVKNAE